MSVGSFCLLVLLAWRQNIDNIWNNLFGGENASHSQDIDLNYPKTGVILICLSTLTPAPSTAFCKDN